MSVRLGSVWRDARGSTVIEFALISPLVVILILAAVQLGLALQANAGLRELVGWAGREAVVAYQEQSDGVLGAAALKEKIESRAKLGSYNLHNGTLKVAVTTQQDTTLLTVNRVNLRVDYDYPLTLPFLPPQTIEFAVQRTFFVPNASSV